MNDERRTLSIEKISTEELQHRKVKHAEKIKVYKRSMERSMNVIEVETNKKFSFRLEWNHIEVFVYSNRFLSVELYKLIGSNTKI